MFITDCRPYFKLLYHKHIFLITNVVDGSIFLKIFYYNLREKRWKKILFLPKYYNDEIIINTKTFFSTDEKLFELFCIEHDFVKYFAKFYNLFLIL